MTVREFKNLPFVHQFGFKYIWNTCLLVSKYYILKQYMQLFPEKQIFVDDINDEELRDIIKTIYTYHYISISDDYIYIKGNTVKIDHYNYIMDDETLLNFQLFKWDFSKNTLFCIFLANKADNNIFLLLGRII